MLSHDCQVLTHASNVQLEHCTFANRVNYVCCLDSRILPSLDIRSGLGLLKLLERSRKELPGPRLGLTVFDDQSPLTWRPLLGTDHHQVDSQGRGNQATECSGNTEKEWHQGSMRQLIAIVLTISGL